MFWILTPTIVFNLQSTLKWVLTLLNVKYTGYIYDKTTKR